MHRFNVKNFQTIIFDCDGVILNSNKIKTEAFFEVTKSYSLNNAERLKEYHILNGGISREEKFKHFFNVILKKKPKNSEMKKLLNDFSSEVCHQLLNCEINNDLEKFKEFTPNAKWLVISGGNQDELRKVFLKRKISFLFDGGIFGSPENKDQLIKNQILKKNITGNSVYIGDSLYDQKVSNMNNLFFIFLSKWTEVKDWQKQIQISENSFSDLSELMIHNSSVND